MTVPVTRKTADKLEYWDLFGFVLPESDRWWIVDEVVPHGTYTLVAAHHWETGVGRDFDIPNEHEVLIRPFADTCTCGQEIQPFVPKDRSKYVTLREWKHIDGRPHDHVAKPVDSQLVMEG